MTDKATTIAYDPTVDGVYVAGQFSDSISFGSTTLVAQGFIDGFIARYDGSGNFMWVKQISSTNTFGDVQIRSVTVNDNSDVFLVGSYFQGANVGGIALNGPGDVNIFVAKFSSAGVTMIARNFGSGGIFANEAFGVAWDPDLNCYITGVIVETVVIGSDTLSSPTSESSFVAKLDNNLIPQWALMYGDATAASKGRGISVSGDKVTVCGTFDSQITVNGQNHPSAGGTDAYVVQFDTAGNFQWFNSGGGNGNDEALSISTDELGNSYVGGLYQGVANFSGTSTSTQATENAYVVSYDVNGNLRWLRGPKSRGINGISRTNSVSYLNSNVHIAGNFGDSLSFTTFGISSPPGGNAGFAARYNTSGTALEAIGAGLELNGCATYGQGAYFGGDFAGSFTLDGHPLSSVGDLDVLIFRTELSVSTDEPLQSSGKLGVFPNPWLNTATIEFTNPSGQEISIYVVDLQGRIVQTIHQGWLNDGVYSFPLEGETLSAGVHFILATNGEAKTILRTIKSN